VIAALAFFELRNPRARAARNTGPSVALPSSPFAVPLSYKGAGTPSPRGSAAGFSLDGAARPRARCTDGSPHHGLGEYGDEQSSPNSEKNPRNLCEVMKRNPGFMAKASLASFQARPAG
jgi:hypothetical protein